MSEKYPERTYEFFIHRECLKEVAKPGFAGVKDLWLRGHSRTLAQPTI